MLFIQLLCHVTVDAFFDDYVEFVIDWEAITKQIEDFPAKLMATKKSRKRGGRGRANERAKRERERERRLTDQGMKR